MANQRAHAAPPFTVHNITVDGVDLFYRSSGSSDRPVIILLPGYPSSSHQYRHLLPILGKHYHVLSPDYPGFGFTTVPSERKYTYTFDNLATTVSSWLDALKIKEYALYVFDYGSPIGFRLALQNPAAVKAIISQNGNAYTAGLGPAFSALSDYYNDPSNKTFEQTARDFISYSGTVYQYTTGIADPSIIEPESYTLDAALLAKPGQVETQLALFRDYKTNVDMYPRWHAYLREHQPPVLAAWGEHDPFFIPPGAEAFKADVPDAEVRLIDGGHFLLETQVAAVATLVLAYLKRKGF